MATVTLFAPLAMATTELARSLRYQEVVPQQQVSYVEHGNPRMSWVVAVDCERKHLLRTQWIPGAHDC